MKRHMVAFFCVERGKGDRVRWMGCDSLANGSCGAPADAGAGVRNDCGMMLVVDECVAFAVTASFAADAAIVLA